MNTAKLSLVVILFALGLCCSCKENTQQKDQAYFNETISNDADVEDTETFEQSEEFKQYWYAGEAEISSYKLEQARYGELHDGTAVMVFVTEDFRPNAQVKADTYSKTNISVLKLNATKKFNTGLYPYSVMESTFYPVKNNQHAIKITGSVQEWCGQVYAQLNNRDLFEVQSNSYFETEGDQEFKLDKAILENELWNQLRINPESLPTGDLKVIPSIAFIRLKHIEFKAYDAIATLSNGVYTVQYPQLGRTLTIFFESKFPYQISGWEDSYKDGYGMNAKTLTTKATRMATIKSAYWNKNSNADKDLRKSLKLK